MAGRLLFAFSEVSCVTLFAACNLSCGLDVRSLLLLRPTSASHVYVHCASYAVSCTFIPHTRIRKRSPRPATTHPFIHPAAKGALVIQEILEAIIQSSIDFNALDLLPCRKVSTPRREASDRCILHELDLRDDGRRTGHLGLEVTAIVSNDIKRLRAVKTLNLGIRDDSNTADSVVPSAKTKSSAPRFAACHSLDVPSQCYAAWD